MLDPALSACLAPDPIPPILPPPPLCNTKGGHAWPKGHPDRHFPLPKRQGNNGINRSIGDGRPGTALTPCSLLTLFFYYPWVLFVPLVSLPALPPGCPFTL